MTPEQKQKVSQTLEELLSLDSSRRMEKLQDLKTSDPTLAAEVKSLLEKQETYVSISPASEEGGNWPSVPESVTGLEWDGLPVPEIKVPPPLPAVERVPEKIGPFQIHSQIGKGGMGVVWRVRDPQFRRSLAVKVLGILHKDNTDLKRRFLEEAQLMGQLQHPGIPPVHNLGELPDGRPYFAMKLIRGKTLAAWLKERSAPEQDHPRLLSIFAQVCQTLAYVHAQGIIHRDLKPANIMVGAFNEVQVMDWGLAKVLSSTDSREKDNLPEQFSTICTLRSDSADSATQAGQAMGTPAYMPPEQARGEVDSLDKRSDVFGLGAILCEILTGKPPYTGQTVQDILVQAQQGKIEEALARLSQNVSETELVKLVEDCLAVRQEDRLPNAQSVAERMDSYLNGVQEKLRQTEVERAAEAAKADSERKRRRQAIWMAFVVIGLVVLAGFAFVQGERNRSALQTQSQISFNDWRSQAISLRDLARTTWDKVRVIPFPKPEERKEAKQRWKEVIKSTDSGDHWQSHTDPELQHQAKELVPDLRKEAETALRDLLTLDKLDEARELRMNLSDKDFELVSGSSVIVFGHGAIEAYAKSFRDHGIDPLKDSPEEAGKRIASAPIKVPMVAALDDWIPLEVNPAVAIRLYEIAHAADPDPFRDPLRKAVVDRDGKKLKQLATEVLAGKDLPIPTAILLADGLHLTEELELAVQVLEQTHKKHPGDFWINDILGVFLINLDPTRTEEAGRYFAMTIAVRPDSYPVYVNLGIVHLAKERWIEAERAFQKALELKPDFLQAKVRLSSTLFEKGKHQEAMNLCKEVLKEQPNNFQASIFLASQLFNLGNNQDAEEILQQAIKRKPNYLPLQLQLATIQSHDPGNLDSLVEKVQGLAEKHPRLIDAHLNLASLWIKKKNHEKALQALDTAAKLQPKNGAIYSGKFLLFVEQRNYEQADKAAKKAFVLRPECWREFSDIGAGFLKKNELDKAAFALEWAVRVNPASTTALYFLGKMYERKKDYSRAIEAFKSATEIDPKNKDAYFALAWVFGAQKQYDAAITPLLEVAKLDPDNAVAHADLGFLYSQKQEWETAITHLKKAVDLAPTHITALNNLGYAFNQRGDFDKAIPWLEKAVQLDPKNKLAQSNLGIACQFLGEGRKSLQCYQVCARESPMHPGTHQLIALTFLELGEFQSARDALKKAMELTAANSKEMEITQLEMRKLDSLLRMEPELPRILKGQEKPADFEQRMLFGRLCRLKQYYFAALGFYNEALAKDGAAALKRLNQSDNLIFGRMGVLAGTGQGKDPPPEKERPACRKQGLKWLRDYLDHYRKQFEKHPRQNQRLCQVNIRPLLYHSDFAPVHLPALKNLPEKEQKEWQTFWEDVQRFLAEVDKVTG